MSTERDELYAFGPYFLNVQERRLERAGRKPNGALTDKAFKTLCVLVRNPGHLVTKKELFDEVWPNSFVEENNLDKCIHAIRRALNETSRQKYIETIPKHGYRFVAEVRRISVNDHGVEIEDDAPSRKWVNIGETAQIGPGQGSKTKVLALTIGLVVLGAITFGLFIYRERTTPSASFRSIAVLPIKPINAASRDELYEVGTADSLINRLSLVKGLVVRPLSAVRKYTDVNQDSLAAGREQKVDYVLDSNYQLADGKFRITSQLVNVASGTVEETYITESDSSRVFAVQDAVAWEFSNRILARFGMKPGGPYAKRGTESEEAYRMYLHGMFLYDKRDPEKLRKATESFEQAVRLDANYAQAWAGKSHANSAVTIYGRDADPHEEFRLSIEAINKALALNPDLPEAHSALCEIKFIYEWDFAGAEKACRRAVELSPNSALAHQTYARFLHGQPGHLDDAITEIKTAIDFEPASQFSQQLFGLMLQHARRYDEAIAQFGRAITLNEGIHSNYAFLSMTLALAGKESESFDVWMRSPEMKKSDDETVRTFRTAFDTFGWKGVMQERLKRADKDGRTYYISGCWAGQVGDKDKAFEYLEKAYERREYHLYFLQIDPRIDPLRDDPRYHDLVARINLHSAQ